jgi:nitroimidazol reductase NimA-like FMN-containing flavoprotein (pyridoxamine 5'-phosphate oxidase superfamily)
VTSREASWADVAARLEGARSYWLATCAPDGAPHVAPVWGAVVAGDLYLFSERRTLKARNVAANAQVAIHLESAEDVVIVRGVLEDLGVPDEYAEVLDALKVKYPSPEDAQYLPPADPDFDVLWRLRPRRALMWRLDDYEESQARWRL